MTEESKQTVDGFCVDARHDPKINLLKFWRITWKRRKMIISIAAAATFATIIASLLMTNIYNVKTVISPIAGRDSGIGNAGLSALAEQLGGLPSTPSSTSATASEIVNLLNSNILKRKVIEQHNLMPILFYGQWDKERRTWKQGYTAGGVTPFKFFRIPDTWDAIRLLDRSVRVYRNNKDNAITLSVDFHDPKLAALIADDYLVSLTDHMSSEVKRVAAMNRKYLEEQLSSTTDPFIKQKTYNLIAHQIEAGMMAEVKENFAFKIIDPPLPPDKKIKPHRGQIVLLALFISLLAGIGLAQLMEYYEKLKKNSGEGGK